MFSKRIDSIPASPIRKLAPFAERAKNDGKNVIPLNIGQPDIHTPKEYFDKIKSLDNIDVVAYGSSEGKYTLRKAFSDYYATIGISMDPDDFLITTGGSEAISFSIAVACDPGDDVLIFEPYYANYASLARMNGVNVVPVTTRRENNFCLPDLNEMNSCVTSKTKALIITNPNNPTGSVYTREEIENVVKLAIDNDLFIISDEVYREFIYDGASYVSFADYPLAANRLIMIDSVSKRFSGCGMRIGCLATKNKEFIAQAMKLCQARLCVSGIEQLSAAAMFSTDKSYIKNAVDEYQKRRDVLCECLADIPGVEYEPPHGAFYVIVKLPIENSDDFARWMLTDYLKNNDETVLICPAADFYATPSSGINEIRISYCINCEKLKKAMQILKNGLEEYKNIQ